MRVGFAGTPEFAAHALQAILDAGHILPLVLTQPDRPHGRGLRLEASAVKKLAVAHGVTVLQPASLKRPSDREGALAIPVDVLVVAAYGLVLPPEVLAWPRYGCLNIHASKLPRWRGAAPIQRAIEAGDTLTGVTIMQMDAGLDTGPTVEIVEVAIDSRETAGSLHDKLAVAGASAIVAALARLAREGQLTATPQPQSGATYASKIQCADALLDWTQSAQTLDRRVRAFDPVPGAFTRYLGRDLKVWEARTVDRQDDASPPGTILASTADGIDVACGLRASDGALRLTVVQPAGGRRMGAAAFLAGRSIEPGTRFAVATDR